MFPQAEIDRKKEDMKRRDVVREVIKVKQHLEAAAKNAEAQAKAETRIKAALDQNKSILRKRREDFDAKQRLNEQRRRWGLALIGGSILGLGWVMCIDRVVMFEALLGLATRSVIRG